MVVFWAGIIVFVRILQDADAPRSHVLFERLTWAVAMASCIVLAYKWRRWPKSALSRPTFPPPPVDQWDGRIKQAGANTQALLSGVCLMVPVISIFTVAPFVSFFLFLVGPTVSRVTALVWLVAILLVTAAAIALKLQLNSSFRIAGEEHYRNALLAVASPASLKISALQQQIDTLRSEMGTTISSLAEVEQALNDLSSSTAAQEEGFNAIMAEALVARSQAEKQRRVRDLGEDALDAAITAVDDHRRRREHRSERRFDVMLAVIVAFVFMIVGFGLAVALPIEDVRSWFKP